MSDANEQKNGDKLMRILPGETREQALDRWWRDNGLDHIAARIKRKQTYMEQLKEAAEIMNRFKGR